MQKKVEMVTLGILSLMDALLEINRENNNDSAQPFLEEAQTLLSKAHHEMYMAGKALPEPLALVVSA